MPALAPAAVMCLHHLRRLHGKTLGKNHLGVKGVTRMPRNDICMRETIYVRMRDKGGMFRREKVPLSIIGFHAVISRQISAVEEETSVCLVSRVRQKVIRAKQIDVWLQELARADLRSV